MAGTVYTTDQLSEWAEYYSQLDQAGPYHDPSYLTALAGHFEPPEVAELFVYDPDDADGFVYYPYLRRPLSSLPFAGEADISLAAYSDIVSSWYYGGPLLSPGADQNLASQFAEAFTTTCADRGVVAEFIRFDPTVDNHADFVCLDPTFNRETVPVDLSGTVEDVWDGYEDRNRRAIKQGKETDIKVESTDDSADVDAFHDIYSDAMEAKDADPHYRFDASFFQDLVDRPDLATLLVARYEGSVIGGFLAVHDGRLAHHFLSASIPDYWDMRVNNLLYHEVVMHFHDRGYEMFDFQGGRPGVFKFKKGFSRNRGEFFLATRTHLPDTYETLTTAAANAGIETDTDYFPAYRVEQSN